MDKTFCYLKFWGVCKNKILSQFQLFHSIFTFNSTITIIITYTHTQHMMLLVVTDDKSYMACQYSNLAKHTLCTQNSLYKGVTNQAKHSSSDDSRKNMSSTITAFDQLKVTHHCTSVFGEGRSCNFAKSIFFPFLYLSLLKNQIVDRFDIITHFCEFTTRVFFFGRHKNSIYSSDL